MKKSGNIHLTDVSETVFKEFLQFFYLNEVELSTESIADLMYLGHKYMVTNCIDVCIRFLTDCHTVDNVLFVLSIAMLHSHRGLIKLCERFIVRNTNAVFKSRGFLECDRQMLAHILNANLFNYTEVELFEACMAWVKAKSGHDFLSKEIVDEHLGKLFYEIRFGSMTIEEFCRLATMYNAVLSKDFQTITNLIALPEFQQNKFNTQRRQIKWTNDDDDGGGRIKDRVAVKPKSANELIYQISPMNAKQLDHKKQFKCIWVSFNFSAIDCPIECFFFIFKKIKLISYL